MLHEAIYELQKEKMNGLILKLYFEKDYCRRFETGGP
jgi:hypothetical protein